MADNTAEQQDSNLPEAQANLSDNRVANPGSFKPGNRLSTTAERTGHLWSKQVKRQEFRRTIQRVIAIRDGRVREMDFDEHGKRIWVYPSVQNLLKACEIMLGYTAGKPAQRIDIDIAGDAERPNTLSIVLNRPTTKEQRTEAGKQIIALANTIDDEQDK